MRFYRRLQLENTLNHRKMASPVQTTGNKRCGVEMARQRIGRCGTVAMACGHQAQIAAPNGRRLVASVKHLRNISWLYWRWKWKIMMLLNYFFYSKVMPSANQPLVLTFLISSLIFKFSLVLRHCFVRLWKTMPYSILHIDESLEKVVVVT